jgi:hypothetical protein
MARRRVSAVRVCARQRKGSARIRARRRRVTAEDHEREGIGVMEEKEKGRRRRDGRENDSPLIQRGLAWYCKRRVA